MTQLFEPSRIQRNTLMRACSVQLSVTTRLTLTLGLLLSLCGIVAPHANASEPAQRFVEQLRAAGHFEMALEYLQRVPNYPGVDPSFLEVIELERAQTLLAAGQRSRLADQRDSFFSDATGALNRFLDQHPNHPRRSEAQLQLGNLQLVRGAELMELGGEPDEDRRGRARDAFAGAVSTFDQIVDDLREKLKAMQGRKLDPEQDFEAIAQRDAYRGEYLTALLMGGEARKRAAETFATPNDEQKRWYNEALQRYEELGDKYDDTVAGIRAMLYAGQVNLALGDPQKAADNFLNVITLTDEDVLRPEKALAVVGLMKIDMDKSPPEYQAAIDRGQPWADDVRPDERDAREFQELRLELAKAYLGSRETIEATPDKRRAEAAARALLRPVAKSPGPFQPPAEKLLAELGITDPAGSDVDLADMPDNFADALARARELLEDEKNKALAVELVQRRVQDGEPLDEQLQMAKDDLASHRELAAQFVRRMLGLADEETSRDDLIQARYWLAYLLLRSEHYREAAVVGEFVARRYPASELGLFSGLTAVNAWQAAYRDAAPEFHEGILTQLQRVATYVVDQWPQDPQAASAREMLVRLSIGNGQLERAKTYLAALPEDHPARTELQQALATLMWNEAVRLQKDGDLEAATATRKEMINTLATGLAQLQSEQVDEEALRIAVLLAKAQLINDDSAGALATLDNATYGPLQRIGEVAVTDAGLKADIYANALQAIVSQLTGDAADADALLKRASQAMSGLQQAYADQPDGNQKLVAQFFRLARDIRSQMDSAPPAKQQRLLGAFQLFLDELASQSTDAKTLHWAAQTMLGLARDQMDASGVAATNGTAETANKLVLSAVDILQQIEQRAKDEPGWIESPKMRTQVRLELGTAARLAGDFKTAIDTLHSVLRENEMLIDAQIEAALTYEQWAASLKPQYATISYQRAIGGAKPNAQTRRNVIWGWGTISKRTMASEQFRDTFFDARYHLALCRFLQGKQEADADKSKKLIEQAKADIRAVQVRFGDLGGTASSQRFDLLLREIQKALGQPANGLAEFP